MNKGPTLREMASSIAASAAVSMNPCGIPATAGGG